MTSIHTFMVKAGWLIEGSGRPAINHTSFYIIQGKFWRNLPQNTDTDGLEVIDLSGCTVLPGLIDSHVHLSMSGNNDPIIRQQQLTSVYEQSRLVISRHIAESLKFGVAAVRDGGDSSGHVLRYKQEQAEFPTRLLLAVSGKAWHVLGRYGKLISRPLQPGTKLKDAILAHSANIDQVKIVNSGLNSLTQFGKETVPQFDAAELKEAAAAAKELGIKTMIHANSRIPVKMTIMAKCDSIEHGFFMGQENLELMAQYGVIWVPTACTMYAYAEQLQSFPEKAHIASRNLEHQITQLTLARKIGVKTALGTDSGSLGVHHGASVIDEIKLFIQAGYTIEEIIACSVKHGAELLPPGPVGPFTNGKTCSFIAVPGSPQQLPESLRSICMFYRFPTGFLNI